MVSQHVGCLAPFLCRCLVIPDTTCILPSLQLPQGHVRHTKERGQARARDGEHAHVSDPRVRVQAGDLREEARKFQQPFFRLVHGLIARILDEAAASAKRAISFVAVHERRHQGSQGLIPGGRKQQHVTLLPPLLVEEL
eukprot:1155224-Pelagomonas_calceolata.AAC.10